MGMITSIRAPVPVAPTPPAPPSRPQGTTGATAPVAATALEQAVQQGAAKSAATDPQVMMAWASVESSAAAAAESARQAYIKASIAAGISPLPTA